MVRQAGDSAGVVNYGMGGLLRVRIRCGPLVGIGCSVGLLFGGLSACGGSQHADPTPSSTPTEAVKAVFLRWNSSAKNGDSKAAMFLCASPEISENEPDPVPPDHPGFNVPDDINVQVGDGTAGVDFLDPGIDAGLADDEDVFVTLIQQNGSWKVCRYQVTAAGGIG